MVFIFFFFFCEQPMEFLAPRPTRFFTAAGQREIANPPQRLDRFLDSQKVSGMRNIRSPASATAAASSPGQYTLLPAEMDAGAAQFLADPELYARHNPARFPKDSPQWQLAMIQLLMEMRSRKSAAERGGGGTTGSGAAAAARSRDAENTGELLDEILPKELASTSKKDAVDLSDFELLPAGPPPGMRIEEVPPEVGLQLQTHS